ncbi:MAG TPA: aspartate/glutamate racemase family protein [Solirubrobacteraceae bacterium]|nr:aspartate/glutamate racemase family protein [Solirubrobacteraceae bacterium]
MPRVCVLVPFAFDEKGLANRRAQQESVRLSPDVELDFKPVKAGPALYDSYHDYVLADFAMLEAGLEAAAEGYDAICIDTMSDSGANALRSMLDIPVIAPGRASYLTALMLGHKFSVLTQWDGWIALYHKGAREYGLEDHLVSVRSINTPPDVENLLGGKEDVVFPKLRDAGLQCVQDGADVICLGSTTMHQAHAYLAENLPVPVINPGPLTYKLAETMLSLGLSQSRQAYPQPNVEKRAMIQAMAQAAADSEKAPA